MAKGSCLCGVVRYEVANPFDEMHHCHCGMCRKAHGAAFSTFARADKADFRFLAGEDKVRGFRSSPPIERSFCEACGSNLLFLFDPLPDFVWVAVGTLDEDPGLRPQAHIFTGSQAAWHTILDDLPRFEGYPPQE
jgi:hypothetical protein